MEAPARLSMAGNMIISLWEEDWQVWSLHTACRKIVMVLEYGVINRSNITQVPYLGTGLSRGSMFNITSAPDPFISNRTYGVRAGAVVGGGLIINEPGVHFVEDAALRRAMGVFWVPASIHARTQTRSSALTAYYDSSSSRRNLKLLTEHQVTELTFRGGSNVVSGVKATNSKTDEQVTFRATREVILAAGAIHTPQTLQMSASKNIANPAFQAFKSFYCQILTLRKLNIRSFKACQMRDRRVFSAGLV
ncbi:hypothetical protein AJ80_02497 [Polytolypa hystricis UAMH7299]|uniref:glucose oxidase n=1 Tax=Polytolypa hystricis (strain UAMH7299) TaxID=1447883 RepID=A0A2B7YS03_POLH7|nr:hypothetical protein AJ80_02497 [Polytolypa hystricis UAMH7299]